MKPFLAGRPTLEGVALRPSTGPLESSAPLSTVHASGHGHAHGQSSGLVPSVESIKQGDKVVRLVVTCTCGERIEIECLYPAGG